MSSTTPQLPTQPTPKDIGHYLEVTVCNRLNWDHVDDDQAGYLDARTATGKPADVKGARREVCSDSTPRAGRWWIQRDNHQQLRQEDGSYALVVYDQQGDHVEIEHLAVLPADTLDALVPGWVGIPEDHVTDADDAAQISWTRLFDRGGGHQ